jgi:hypothetical protein
MAKKATQEETQPATSAAETPAAPAQNELVIDQSAHASYANLCRVTGSPEEVILDFALNPNAFGHVLDEVLKVDHRVVMGYEAAKRTALVLLETVRRHEERFGTIELDPRKRLKDQSN